MIHINVLDIQVAKKILARHQLSLFNILFTEGNFRNEPKKDSG